MKIYTKTGDTGDTGLWGGGRISKSAARIHAYGTIDECNAALGIVRTCKLDSKMDSMLSNIQNLLFVCGSDLATPGDQDKAIDRISLKDTELLEGWIDDMEKSLPKLKQFIIPGGSPAAAHLHLARTVCRRAERWIVEIVRDDPVHKNALTFVNRLSDFLFVSARTVNIGDGLKDTHWNSPRRGKK
jgi:cob(I)alamin adenosyltransferase